MSKQAEMESLLNDWEARSMDCGHGAIGRDGWLYRGDLMEGEHYRARNTGNEVESWLAADKRLLILTKDVNDVAWDIRQETGLTGSSPDDIQVNRSSRFYPNMMRWACAILSHDSDGSIKDYDSAESDIAKLDKSVYNSSPIARVNCKKQAGGGKISSKDLREFITRYKDLLIRQIGILDPNIILCCGTDGNLLIDFVASYCMERFNEKEVTIKPVNKYVYYSPEHDLLVINFCHPSYYGKGERELYELLKDSLTDFKTRYPNSVITRP